MLSETFVKEQPVLCLRPFLAQQAPTRVTVGMAVLAKLVALV
jgi:hypothetical protein